MDYLMSETVAFTGSMEHERSPSWKRATPRINFFPQRGWPLSESKSPGTIRRNGPVIRATDYVTRSYVILGRILIMTVQPTGSRLRSTVPLIPALHIKKEKHDGRIFSNGDNGLLIEGQDSPS